MSQDLRSLIIMGLTDGSRAAFPDLVRSTLWPDELRVDTPIGIVTDWLRDRDMEGEALILEKLEAEKNATSS